MQNAELRKKRSIQGKGTLPQKRVRQRRESLTDWRRSDAYKESLAETSKTNV